MDTHPRIPGRRLCSPLLALVAALLLSTCTQASPSSLDEPDSSSSDAGMACVRVEGDLFAGRALWIAMQAIPGAPGQAASASLVTVPRRMDSGFPAIAWTGPYAVAMPCGPGWEGDVAASRLLSSLSRGALRKLLGLTSIGTFHYHDFQELSRLSR